MFRRLLISLGNWLREPEVGDRVVLIADAELFDDGIIRKGAAGVVLMKSWAADPAEPIATVLMDRHFAVLAPWNNRLQVWPKPGPHGSVTWSHFKTVTSL